MSEPFDKSHDGVLMGLMKDVFDVGEKIVQSWRKRHEQNTTTRVLSAMPAGKNLKRAEIATLAHVSEDEALRALRVLKEADQVISLDVDEEPKETFWRRI